MSKQEKLPTEKTISTSPFPGSAKVYVPGVKHDINVAMREISVSGGPDAKNGKPASGSRLTVYDTSGPYTDPSVRIDLKAGLPRIREKWIFGRGDVEQLPDISSSFGRERLYRSD